MDTLAYISSRINVTETIKPVLDDMAPMFAKHYQQFGKHFITCFLKFKTYEMALAFTVKNFQDNVMPYEPDEKITQYVDSLKLYARKSDLLKRALKMIRLIQSAD